MRRSRSVPGGTLSASSRKRFAYCSRRCSTELVLELPVSITTSAFIFRAAPSNGVAALNSQEKSVSDYGKKAGANRSTSRSRLCAIELGWLWRHKSGTDVKLTPAGACSRDSPNIPGGPGFEPQRAYQTNQTLIRKLRTGGRFVWTVCVQIDCRPESCMRDEVPRPLPRSLGPSGIHVASQQECRTPLLISIKPSCSC
jgi:hypothetical protein